jgi:hypothetical protein
LRPAFDIGEVGLADKTGHRTTPSPSVASQAGWKVGEAGFYRLQ